MSSLCHIWWICGCAESFALVLKWGGPGVRRKGLPQAPPAVWWSVAGSFSQPSGTITTLWSVSFSDLPGQGKSALFFYLQYIYVQQIYEIFHLKVAPHLIAFFIVFMSESDWQLISVALQHDSGIIFIGRSMLIFFSIVPISFGVTEVGFSHWYRWE